MDVTTRYLADLYLIAREEHAAERFQVLANVRLQVGQVVVAPKFNASKAEPVTGAQIREYAEQMG